MVLPCIDSTKGNMDGDGVSCLLCAILILSVCNNKSEGDTVSTVDCFEEDFYIFLATW